MSNSHFWPRKAYTDIGMYDAICLASGEDDAALAAPNNHSCKRIARHLFIMLHQRTSRKLPSVSWAIRTIKSIPRSKQLYVVGWINVSTHFPGKTRLQHQDSDGILPTVNSLLAGALPLTEPPPPQLDDNTPPSFVDESVNSTYSNSSSSSSFCDYGNCYCCDDY